MVRLEKSTDNALFVAFNPICYNTKRGICDPSLFPLSLCSKEGARGEINLRDSFKRIPYV